MSKKNKAVYANGISVSFGPTEVRMLFSLNTPVIKEGKDTGELTWDEVADVRINPMLAKRLCNILVENLEKLNLPDMKVGDAKEEDG